MPSAPSLRPLRTVVLAMASAPLVMLVACAPVLESRPAPDRLFALLASVAAVLCTAAAFQTGRTVQPLAPGLTPEQIASASAQAVRSSTLTAASVATAIGVIGLSMAFASSSGGMLIAFPSLVVSCVVTLLTAWPSAARLAVLQGKLASSGAVVPALDLA